MKDLDIINQSKAAYKQWGEQWRKQAKDHSKYQMKDIVAFQNIGVGKAILVIANGYSFEKELETIKKHQGNVDILCVDKCLKHCLENGITPTYVLVCDANVSYEKYMKPVQDKLSNTILFANVCANPEWAKHGNWKDIYFFVNKDVLKSEQEFAALSGCQNFIAAGTNVSNAAVVLLTQCDDRGPNNFFGYDKILLIGFDYSWDESYYAFDRDGGGKKYYMKQAQAQDLRGNIVHTSPNLLFSAKWFEKYRTVFKLHIVQCSQDSIVPSTYRGSLEQQMQYRYKAEDAKEVCSLLEYRRELAAKIEIVNNKIRHIGNDHHQQILRTV